MPLERLLEDAIYHAQKNGVLVTQGQQDLTQEELDELRDVPGFAETYLFDGVVPKTRQVLKQPALGNTLARLAEVGLNDMFDGLTAPHNARYLEAVGSPLRLADFKAYRAKQVLPLQVSIGAGTLFNMPPPTQGISSLMILALFDRLRVTQGESFDHIHGLVETTKQAFTLRNAYVTDLEFMDVDPMAGWIVHFSTRWRATFMQNKRWNGLSQQNQVTQSG
jgi:gamma-glutamyltranspeptidase